MRKFKKVLMMACVMVLLSSVNIRAETVSNAGGSGTAKLDIEIVPVVFSATVPTKLVASLNSQGKTYAIADVYIQNNSNASIRVTSISVTEATGWLLKDKGTLSNTVGTQEFTVEINNTMINSTGVAQASLINFPAVASGSSLKLVYDVNIPPRADTSAVVDTIADVSFTLNWSN